MTITNVKIRKILEDEKFKAVVSITFDESLCVHDIKIIEIDGKVFLAMPSRKSSDGVFRDVAHPINKEFRDYIQKSVLEEYYNKCE